MIISWLTLRDLEYVVAVAENEHFGRAAQQCHISQPSLSAQIKKIEGYLGVSLFERNNRRVSVTEAGRRVAAQAQVVLDEARKIPTVLGKDAKPLSGTLKLGAITTLGPYLMPHFLGYFRTQFPNASLILREGLTVSLIEELRAGTLDAVLAAKTFDDTGLKSFELFFESFVLAAPHGHPILNHKPLRPSDMKAAEMVLLEDGHCLRDQTLESCPSNRRGNVRQFHATSIETLRHLVATGLGYTLLPKLATRDRPMKDLIAYRNFDQPNIGRDVILFCRSRYAGLADVELLARSIIYCRPKDVILAKS